MMYAVVSKYEYILCVSVRRFSRVGESWCYQPQILRFLSQLLQTLMMFSNISSAPGMATVLLLFSLVKAQLSGPVGPLTTISRKAAKKTCNVVNYGAVAGSSNDFGPALLAAWNACASGGLGGCWRYC